jgi:metallo-beta-lactamase family protein
MYLTSYGAAREVTGSMHLITTEQNKILLDCGMFQGRRVKSREKNKTIPIDPKMITSVILSHAHIDHCGRIPLLFKERSHCRVHSTRPTLSACHYLLKDSAHIQESDAEYLNYKLLRNFLHKIEKSKKKKKKVNIEEIKKLLKNGRHKIRREKIDELMDEFGLEKIKPLYTNEDAENALKNIEGFPYRYPVTIGQDAVCTFYEAGHILGSAQSLIKITEKNETKRLLYTGDIGRFDKPIIRDPNTNFPEDDKNIDLLILESTYGNRIHDPVVDLKEKLKDIIIQTTNRGGSLLIPSFAFGRSQELIYVLHELYNEGVVPRLPIYLDSPLAINITKVFGEHPEVYDELTHKTFLESGENPFIFDYITFVQSVEESIDLVNSQEQNIVISASGMCEAGRILHHLRYKIHNSNHTILVVGYMAENTLGRKILEKGNEYAEADRKGSAPLLKFFNKEYPLRARVKELGGFSAHGDRREMLNFLKQSGLNIKKITLVHGEEKQVFPFQEFLKANGFKAIVPRQGEIVRI